MSERQAKLKEELTESAIIMTRGIAKKLETSQEITQEELLGFLEQYPITLLLALIIEQEGRVKREGQNADDPIYPSIFDGHRDENPDYFLAVLYTSKPNTRSETIGLYAKGRDDFGLDLPLTPERRLDVDAFLRSDHALDPARVVQTLRRASTRIADNLEGISRTATTDVEQAQQPEPAVA